MTIQINNTEDLFRSFLPTGASQNDYEIFKHLCNRTGLDPVLKQIYPVARKSRKQDGSYYTSITFQTSIDGYRLIAERTGKYSPGKEPVFTYDKQGKLFSATSYVKKMTPDGTWHEIGATAFWQEYAQTKDGQPVQFWAKMGHLMLAKCAEALALRKAFPDQYARLYTDDEMLQAQSNDEEKGEEKREEKESESKSALQTQECKPALQKINQVEATVLQELLKECEISYQEKFYDFLFKQFNTDVISMLPKSAYERLESALLKKKKEREDTMELAHA